MPGGHARLPVSMTTLGLIGSGSIGSTVARLAVDAGHDVVLSNSRGPETLEPRRRAGPAGPGGDRRGGRRGRRPGAGEHPAQGLPVLPSAALAGKVVLDTGNYYPERDGRIAELDPGSLTDREYLARHLPGAQVVKVFNNIFFKHLLNLARPGRRPATAPTCRSPATKQALVPRPRSSLDRLRRGRRRDRWPMAGGRSRALLSTERPTARSRTRRAPRPTRRSSAPRSPPRPG